MDVARNRAAKAILLLLLSLGLGARGQTPGTVVVEGDSLAVGLGVLPEQSFPALLQQKIDAARLPYKIINASVSGDTSADGVTRMAWLLRRPMDVLILELGGNDGLRGIAPEATAANLQTIIDKARAKNPAVKIIIAGLQMPPSMGEAYTAPFARLFPELARKNRAALIPFLLQGVGGIASLNQADGIHPTAEGQRIVARNVWQVLETILEERASH